MRTYIVEESKKITPSTLLLTLRRDEMERPLAFLPGQYAAISYEHQDRKSTTRCFSIVSSPTEQNLLQFSMRVRGSFTTALSNLQKDDIVNVGGPFGGFVFDTNRDKQAVFIAGGIGITPFISMMRYLAAFDAKNEVTLLYSCQIQDDIPFGAELTEIQKQHPNLKTIFVVAHDPVDKLPAAHVARGAITPELLDTVTDKDYSKQRFFLCGPPGFITAMSATITKKGATRQQIMTEAFTQSSPKQTSILRSWPANIYALGVIGFVLGGTAVTMVDLFRLLPSSASPKATSAAPYLITNARQQQLDQLVNSIPPSPSVIGVSTTSTTNVQSTTVSPQPTTLSPIYQAAPRTTASAPPP